MRYNPDLMLKRSFITLALLPAALVMADPVAPPPLPPAAAAVVNGEAIPLAELQALLLKRHGAEALTELVFKRLIDQEARRAGIEVAEEDIKARYAVALEELKKQFAQEVTLAAVLQAQGISEPEFREQVITRLTLEKLVVREDLCGAWVRLRIVAAKSEEKAQALLAELRKGADLPALARKESTDPSAAHDGDLGPRFRGELPPELEPEAFSGQVGVMTGVIKMPAGFVVARIEERQEARPRPWAEIRSEIEKKLAKEPPSQEALDRYLSRLRRAASVQTLPLPRTPP